MFIYKYKIFFDFSREECWLAEMAKSGYFLVSINSFGKYTFEKIEPCQYNYKIDYRIFKKSDDFEDYRSLFEDSGWKHLHGSHNSGYQYFVQASTGAPSEIFSDASSKAGRYKRLSTMWLSLTIAFFPIFTVLLMTNQYDISAFTNPRALYLTPGLWEMSGVRFWRSFLFETPFAFGRGFMWLLFLALLLFYFAAFIKTLLLYRRYSNELLN